MELVEKVMLALIGLAVLSVWVTNQNSPQVINAATSGGSSLLKAAEGR
jgi:hypothetical protein